MHAPLRLVLAVTGASGAACARRFLRRACTADRLAELHFVISDAGRRVAHEELGARAANAAELVDAWLEGVPRRAEVIVHAARDVGAPPASGSFRHDGMIVLPCSTATLGAVARGVTSNLVHRAAECTLKERRPLVLAVRETPLSLVHLENMTAAARAGATILPLSPGWYHGPESLEDLMDACLDRAFDHLGLPEVVTRRWGGRG